jgi:ppGpp synthetase/RelA/SpoT-type nucleotidyltranferase
MALSKTQIDKLGERLKAGETTDQDLRLLDDYRRSFAEAYEHVVETIRSRFDLRLTGRPAKSTASIVEKLRRESIRLSQIQDIAGCRMIVGDVVAQNQVVRELTNIIPAAIVVDRRVKPSHSYRAVHIIASLGRHAVEIQVRSELQHKWAELSEKLSDAVDPTIKYGGGQIVLRELLKDTQNLSPGLK